MKLKLAFALSLLILSACAKEKPTDPVSCYVQADVAQHPYPNGQVIKSDVEVCSNGCTNYLALDNSGLTDTKCN